MMMAQGLRRFMLTAHVLSSVGWLGAVATFLALAVTGLITQDESKVRASYLAMELITSLVIVPFCLASLLTGLISSLGTKWGLFRHYWVLIKFLITVVCTIILLVHLSPIRYMAGVAAETTLTGSDLYDHRLQLVVASGAALVALLVATTLSVYKPQGITPYGWRKQNT